MSCLEDWRDRDILVRMEDASVYGRAGRVEDAERICLVRIRTRNRLALVFDPSAGTSGIQIGFYRVRYF